MQDAAEADGVVAGASLATGPASLALPTRFKQPAVGWGTYVKPAYRSQGIGRLLWETMIEELRSDGYDAYLGQVHVLNTTSAKMLESLGFQQGFVEVALPL